MTLTHQGEDGAPRMVDVSAKPVTTRTATASGTVLLSAATVELLTHGQAPKGDVLTVARLAAVTGAKQTATLIPLCHPLPLHAVDVDLRLVPEGVRIEVTTRTAERTGVEMEALTAVAVAGLTVIDMVKAVERGAVLTDIRIEAKTGGTRGDWSRT
ncbi:MAG: moaC2 [Frankiales bacterium]|jgi:cyclic pyranopterin phosphate synthase|nr:moaC2 [Frankiales bacterium]